MGYKLGVLLDPPDNINHLKDTSLAIMIAAQKRGWEVSFCMVSFGFGARTWDEEQKTPVCGLVVCFILGTLLSLFGCHFNQKSKIQRFQGSI